VGRGGCARERRVEGGWPEGGRAIARVMSLTLLESLRFEVDSVDQTLLVHVAQRLERVRKIARVKRASGLPVVDLGREDELRSRMLEEGERLDLDPGLVLRLVDLLVDEGRAAVAQVYAETLPPPEAQA
jgi:chorismate mutase